MANRYIKYEGKRYHIKGSYRNLKVSKTHPCGYIIYGIGFVTLKNQEFKLSVKRYYKNPDGTPFVLHSPFISQDYNNIFSEYVLKEIKPKKRRNRQLIEMANWFIKCAKA